MNAEIRRCKHCGKTLIQATYWYCPEEVVYTPNMAAPAYNPYIHRVDTIGTAQNMSTVTFFPNANASAPTTPTFICSHEPAEPAASAASSAE